MPAPTKKTLERHADPIRIAHAEIVAFILGAAYILGFRVKDIGFLVKSRP